MKTRNGITEKIMCGVAETESSSHFQYNCSEKQSSDEFPADVFSYEQRIRGAFLLHLFVLIYCFLIVAFICQNYFLPAVFCICFDLKITPDVAAATFMASATSIPEMSMNVIGTFITESDLGIGTIVGSQICNTLGVAGIAGLAATQGQFYTHMRVNDLGINSIRWYCGMERNSRFVSSKCKITTHEDKIISVSEFVNDLSNNDNGIHRRNEFENNGRNPNGNTFKIPDVVMGMVFLAIGGSVPEASSAFINSRNGIGSMSISNTLGANTLDILLSLGVPWFVKCSISAWSSQYDTAAIYLTTENLEFNFGELLNEGELLKAVDVSLSIFNSSAEPQGPPAFQLFAKITER
ncbi:hypothetical protein PGB90_009662 [Kerria lacca]